MCATRRGKVLQLHVKSCDSTQHRDGGSTMSVQGRKYAGAEFAHAYRGT